MPKPSIGAGSPNEHFYPGFHSGAFHVALCRKQRSHPKPHPVALHITTHQGGVTPSLTPSLTPSVDVYIRRRYAVLILTTGQSPIHL
jgi:hypothetical protein